MKLTSLYVLYRNDATIIKFPILISNIINIFGTSLSSSLRNDYCSNDYVVIGEHLESCMNLLGTDLRPLESITF